MPSNEKGNYLALLVGNNKYIRYYYKGLANGSIEFITHENNVVTMHNENGPAVIHPNGLIEFWLNGIYYSTRSEYLNELEKHKGAAENNCNGKTVTIDGKDYTLILKD